MPATPPSPQLPLDDAVITLHPSRRRWIGIAAIGAAFTATAIALLLVETDTLEIVGLAFAALFFGLAAVVSVVALIPGSAYLRIGPQGIAAKSLWRAQHLTFSEVERFQVYEVRTQYSTQRQVGYLLREAQPGRRSFGRGLSRALAGVDGGLPDTYGRKPEELVALLEAYRERHAGE